jgi:uncharacterized protein YecT (DUF1311 family)
MDRVALILIFLALASTAGADDPTGRYFKGTLINCYSKTSEVEIDTCAAAALEKADGELSNLIKLLISGADEDEEAYLRNMQQAWMKLRDSQCGLVVSYHRGVASPRRWKTRCEAAMTMRRVDEMQELGTGILWRVVPSN